LPFGHPETTSLSQKPRNGGFFAIWAWPKAETGLVGWRHSADGPRLYPLSLLTGNFTGNFAKSPLFVRQIL
jgi:hypothetical protein